MLGITDQGAEGRRGGANKRNVVQVLQGESVPRRDANWDEEARNWRTTNWAIAGAWVQSKGKDEKMYV